MYSVQSLSFDDATDAAMLIDRECCTDWVCDSLLATQKGDASGNGRASPTRAFRMPFQNALGIDPEAIEPPLTTWSHGYPNLQ